MELNMNFFKILFYASLCGSCTILFFLNPIMGKFIHLTFGGAPLTWEIKWLFLNIVLYIGFGYNIALMRYASRRTHSKIHLFTIVVGGSWLLFSYLNNPAINLTGLAPEFNILINLFSIFGLPLLPVAANIGLLFCLKPEKYGDLDHITSNVKNLSWHQLLGLGFAASTVVTLIYTLFVAPATNYYFQQKIWLYLYAVNFTVSLGYWWRASRLIDYTNDGERQGILNLTEGNIYKLNDDKSESISAQEIAKIVAIGNKKPFGESNIHDQYFQIINSANIYTSAASGGPFGLGGSLGGSSVGSFASNASSNASAFPKWHQKMFSSLHRTFDEAPASLTYAMVTLASFLLNWELINFVRFISNDFHLTTSIWSAIITVYTAILAINFSPLQEKIAPYLRAIYPYSAIISLVLVFITNNQSSQLALLINVLFTTMTLGVGYNWISSQLARTEINISFLCLASGGVIAQMVSWIPIHIGDMSGLHYFISIAASATFLLAVMRQSNQSKAPSSSLIHEIIYTALLIGVVVTLRWLLYSNYNNTTLIIFVGILAIIMTHLTYSPRNFLLVSLSLIVFNGWVNHINQNVLVVQESFFGTLIVKQDNEMVSLINGNTIHGSQSLDPHYQSKPITYYYEGGPFNHALLASPAYKQNQPLAVLGLGAGTLAAYGKKDQKVVFYEINEQVVNVAQTYFTYLKSSPAEISIVLGDGREGLNQSRDQYGTIILDAFTSDAIPLHLLTVEAMDSYKNKLSEDGSMFINVSHRHLDLVPMLNTIARHLNMYACVAYDHQNYLDHYGAKSSTWVVFSKSEKAHQEILLSDEQWRDTAHYPLLSTVWTDQYVCL